MVHVHGKTIVLAKGDTGPVRFRVRGETLTQEHRGIFTLAARSGAVLLRKVLIPQNNVLDMMFAHADTEKLRPTEYVWSLRVVRGAKFDNEGRYTAEPESQHTPYRNGRLRLLDTAGGAR